MVTCEVYITVFIGISENFLKLEWSLIRTCSYAIESKLILLIKIHFNLKTVQFLVKLFKPTEINLSEKVIF